MGLAPDRRPAPIAGMPHTAAFTDKPLNVLNGALTLVWPTSTGERR